MKTGANTYKYNTRHVGNVGYFEEQAHFTTKNVKKWRMETKK